MIRDAVPGADMPDEVRAKLHKAIGLEFARRAADTSNAGEAARGQAVALDELTRARQLDPKGAKVDNVIQRLEREAKKAAAAPAPAPQSAPPAAASTADVTTSSGGGDPAEPPPSDPPPPPAEGG